MSRLDKLINELCPNGVEYKKLGEVCQLQRGTPITRQDTSEGNIPVIAGGQKPAYYSNKSNRDGETITVAGSGAYAGYVSYWNVPIYVSDAFSVKGKIACLTKYVYYFLKNVQEKIYSTKKGAGVPHVHIKDIDKFLIPIPPLPVQEEVVRILDKFTELEAELETKLEAELEARRKQYEYYRNALLTFENSSRGGVLEVDYKMLKDVCIDFIVPMRDRPKVFDGDIPWCRIEDIENHSFNRSLSGLGVSETTIKKMNLKVFPTGTVICSCSASIGSYAINTQPLITNQTFIGIVCGEQLNNKYLRYYMETQTDNLLKMATTGTIPYISRKKFENLVIPIPPLSEQERIVNILDKFEALTSDLSEGLPAEIKARRQQYEYYRDKLLTFKRLSA